MAVDYSRLAADYDRGRADDLIDRTFWLRGLIEVGRIRPPDWVLDAGAGTGRFARLLSETNRVVAVDPSRDMLSVAHGKGGFPCVRGDAHCLPFRANTFDVAMVVMVLQHLADFASAIVEIGRASRAIAIATIDMARRRLGIMEEAFPSLLGIDRVRFPAVEAIVAALKAAGFRDVRVEDRLLVRTFTPEAQLERVRHRYVSTFDLLPPGEFERGLRFLESELPRRYPDGYEVRTPFTFLAGTK